MKTKEIFSTYIAQGMLPGASNLNRSLLKEVEAFREEDKLGKKWSQENYKGGYTSYASLPDLHHRYPGFMELEKRLTPEALLFAKKCHWDLKGLELRMTDCWVNIMPSGTYHTLHLHPHSVISGVYYLSTPPGSSPLKLEDPRMSFFMNAPSGEALYETLSAKEGCFILFPSWLRHEVPPNTSKKPRMSVSFNYSLESI